MYFKYIHIHDRVVCHFVHFCTSPHRAQWIVTLITIRFYSWWHELPLFTVELNMNLTDQKNFLHKVDHDAIYQLKISVAPGHFL